MIDDERRMPLTIKQIIIFAFVVLLWSTTLATILLPLVALGMVTGSKRIEKVLVWPLDKFASSKVMRHDFASDERCKTCIYFTTKKNDLPLLGEDSYCKEQQVFIKYQFKKKIIDCKKYEYNLELKEW